MSEVSPDAAATPEAQQTASADPTAARRQAVAVNPAIGLLPAIYVSLRPRRHPSSPRLCAPGSGWRAWLKASWSATRRGAADRADHTIPARPCRLAAVRQRGREKGKGETSRQ
jgi:hypothetical protein